MEIDRYSLSRYTFNHKPEVPKTLKLPVYMKELTRNLNKSVTIVGNLTNVDEFSNVSCAVPFSRWFNYDHRMGN